MAGHFWLPGMAKANPENTIRLRLEQLYGHEDSVAALVVMVEGRLILRVAHTVAVRILLPGLETKFEAFFVLRLVLSSRERDAFVVPEQA